MRGLVAGVEWLNLAALAGQARGSFAQVELAGDDVGDEAGAVLAQELNLVSGAVDCRLSSRLGPGYL